MLDDRQITFGAVSILMGVGLIAGLLAYRKMRRAERSREDTVRSDTGRNYFAALRRVTFNPLTVLLLVACLLWLSQTAPLQVWLGQIAPPPTAAEKERKAAVDKQRWQEDQMKRYFCLAAAACKKYDKVRLECATAGNFKTCLRVKMGSDADYSGACSGYVEGAPALPPSPETPNAVECFLRTLF